MSLMPVPSEQPATTLRPLRRGPRRRSALLPQLRSALLAGPPGLPGRPSERGALRRADASARLGGPGHHRAGPVGLRPGALTAGPQRLAAAQLRAAGPAGDPADVPVRRPAGRPLGQPEQDLDRPAGLKIEGLGGVAAAGTGAAATSTTPSTPTATTASKTSSNQAAKEAAEGEKETKAEKALPTKTKAVTPTKVQKTRHLDRQKAPGRNQRPGRRTD